MNVLTEKFKDVTMAVLPITLIVLILNFTIAPIGIQLILRFIVGAIFIILILGIFSSPEFLGIGFDSGGVASRPMTATFILSFAQGVAEATLGANVLIDAFGVIALVALTPLIDIQILGLL